ncbi:MAG: TIGR03435 family protein [Bryobacteraceae bacterium]
MRQGLLGMLAAVASFGQAPAPAGAARPEFEVASIKASAPGEFDRGNAGSHVDGSQVSFKFLSLGNYIAYAYRVKNYAISGPDWMASERFDITAKLPAGAIAKQLPEILQALLEDRFQMKVHRESKELLVYALVIGKGGLKMQESPPDSPVATQNEARQGFNSSAVPRPGGVTVNEGNGTYYTFADNKFEGRRMKVPNITNALAAFMDRPVVDLTELKGSYDFVLELSPEDFQAMGIRAAIAAGATVPPQAIQMAEAASGDSLSNALEKLGLKLESRKSPVEVLVIDHAEKTPTDN